MNRRRRYNEKIYNQVYQRLETSRPEDMNRCFYCGQGATCLDHQPPIAQIASMIDLGNPFEAYLIPACQHCNSVLSDAATLTLSERMALLKERLRKKYKDSIQTSGKWTIDEVLDLGPSLRKMVFGSIAMGQDAEERILYPGHKLKQTYAWVDGEYSTCKECGCVHDQEGCPICREEDGGGS